MSSVSGRAKQTGQDACHVIACNVGLEEQSLWWKGSGAHTHARTHPHTRMDVEQDRVRQDRAG